MKRMCKFPSIGAYRNAVQSVTNRARYAGKDENGDPIYDPIKPLPTLRFSGTAKLHGTNAAIGHCLSDGETWFQSRENIITVESDNAGFAKYASTIPFDKLIEPVKNRIPDNAQLVVVYGEWCGKGIQKGVAINELDKMFVVFAVKSIRENEDGDTEGEWMTRDLVSKIGIPECRLFNIYDAGHFEIEIDFQKPVLSTEKLDELTHKVEKECPFAKLFNVTGTGEGIVWICDDPEWNTSKVWFKVKGEKHKNDKGETKKLAPADIEKAKDIMEFVDRVVTDARCEQALDFLRMEGKPQDRTSMGDFIRWIFNDVIKEESDTIEASGIDQKRLGGPISKKAKEWLFNWENNNL